MSWTEIPNKKYTSNIALRNYVVIIVVKSSEKELLCRKVRNFARSSPLDFEPLASCIADRLSPSHLFSMLNLDFPLFFCTHSFFAVSSDDFFSQFSVFSCKSKPEQFEARNKEFIPGLSSSPNRTTRNCWEQSTVNSWMKQTCAH